MNILHLINYVGGGGTEQYIYSLIKSLEDKDCDFFIAYSKKGDGFQKFKNLAIPMIHINMDGPFDFQAALKLKRICKDYNIKVIHTHFLRENFISVLSKFLGNKVKLINTRHMLDTNTRLIASFNKFFTRSNDYIIAVSQAVKNLLVSELGDRNNIKLIYTGIDINSWNKANSTFKDEFNLNEETVLITSTARFSEEKGHKFLLDVIDLLNKKGLNNFKFVLVGDGSLLDPMKSYADDLSIKSNIIFTGYRNDIKNILNSSDIFVSASEKEAFGISILEALACSLPVVTTDSGGTREIIEDYTTGFLVDYGNIDDFANILIKLIESKELRKKYGEAGFNLVKNKFSLENMANETFRLYSK